MGELRGEREWREKLEREGGWGEIYTMCFYLGLKLYWNWANSKFNSMEYPNI